MEMTKQYEVSPCREVSTETDDDVERCSPEEAEFWTVYRRMSDGRALAVCDCLTQFDADSCALELNNLLEPLKEWAVVDWSKPQDAIGFHQMVAKKMNEALMTGA